MANAAPFSLEEPKASSDGFFGCVDDKILELKKLTKKAKAISDRELGAVNKRAEALEKLMADVDEHQAEYKIELIFNDQSRTARGLLYGIMLVYQTGVLSGGGDELMYPCPTDNCSGYLAFSDRGNSGEAYCKVCDHVWPEKSLKEMVVYKVPVSRWAGIVAQTFRKLNNSADIILKTHTGTLRSAALKEQVKECRGNNLYDARKRVVLRYSLKAILKDTCAGRPLESAVKGLLTA